MSRFVEKIMASNSGAGKSWLEKYLHPPSVLKADYQGYPDQSNTPTIHSEWRLNGEYLWSKSARLNEQFSCVFLDSPGLFHPTFRLAVPDQIIDHYHWVSLIVNDQINKTDVTSGFTRQRMSYRSTTLYLDSSAFNSQGRVYSAQINPSITVLEIDGYIRLLLELNDDIFILQDDGGDSTYSINEKHPNFQIIVDFVYHLLLLNDMDYNETSEQLLFAHHILNNTTLHKYNKHFKFSRGVSTTDKIDALLDFMKSYIEQKGKLAPPTISLTTVQVADLCATPTTPTSITQCSPKSYTDAALEGCFSVLHVNQPTNEWKDNSPGYWNKGISADDSLKLCAYIAFDSGKIYTTVFYDDNADNKYTADVTWSNFNWQITAFQGLSTTELAGSPAIAYKVIQGFEFNPGVNSMFNTFAKSPPTFDPEALDSAVRIVQNELDAVPSKYNALGLTAALIEGAMSGLNLVSATPKAIKPKLDKTTFAESKAIDEGNKEEANKDLTTNEREKNNMAAQAPTLEGNGAEKIDSNKRKVAFRAHNKAMRKYHKDVDRKAAADLKIILAKMDQMKVQLAKSRSRSRNRSKSRGRSSSNPRPVTKTKIKTTTTTTKRNKPRRSRSANRL